GRQLGPVVGRRPQPERDVHPGVALPARDALEGGAESARLAAALLEEPARLPRSLAVAFVHGGTIAVRGDLAGAAPGSNFREGGSVMREIVDGVAVVGAGLAGTAL